MALGVLKHTSTSPGHPSVFWHKDFHGITELLRLEKPSKDIEPKLRPIPTLPSNSLDTSGMGNPNFPGQHPQIFNPFHE